MGLNRFKYSKNFFISMTTLFLFYLKYSKSIVSFIKTTKMLNKHTSHLLYLNNVY